MPYQYRGPYARPVDQFIAEANQDIAAQNLPNPEDLGMPAAPIMALAQKLTPRQQMLKNMVAKAEDYFTHPESGAQYIKMYRPIAPTEKALATPVFTDRLDAIAAKKTYLESKHPDKMVYHKPQVEVGYVNTGSLAPVPARNMGGISATPSGISRDYYALVHSPLYKTSVEVPPVVPADKNIWDLLKYGDTATGSIKPSQRVNSVVNDNAATPGKYKKK